MKKPSYLGLLNALAIGEGEAAEYLSGWADITKDPEVGKALRTVIAREAEHSAVFTRRLDELGYTVLPKPNPNHAKRVQLARSADRMFNNHDIDITTGALLGRYIAEERDTLRLLHGVYRKLRRRAAAAA